MMFRLDGLRWPRLQELSGLCICILLTLQTSVAVAALSRGLIPLSQGLLAPVWKLKLEPSLIAVITAETPASIAVTPTLLSTTLQPTPESAPGNGLSEKVPSGTSPDFPPTAGNQVQPVEPDALGKSVKPVSSLSHKKQPFKLRVTGNRIDGLGYVVKDEFSKPYVVADRKGNAKLMRFGSSELFSAIAAMLLEADEKANRDAVEEVMSDLEALSHSRAPVCKVSLRVARQDDGKLVLALHDANNTHIRIGPNKVEVVTEGSDTLFNRPATSRPMTNPAESCSVTLTKLLKPYFNLSAVDLVLLIGWISYTLAHAKEDGTVYPIAVLNGGQGSGKSLASKFIIRMVDPSLVGVQRLPRQIQDLAIATQNSHLLIYDNLRSLSHEMSDALCTVATGGSLTQRKLYSDNEQSVLKLHAAVVLNGINAFVDQPDLAQRCVPHRLQLMAESNRRSEKTLLDDFDRDLPAIQRGLFDLIASVLATLPTAKVTCPQRMYEFVRWLAAMEAASDIPNSPYQLAYADALNEGQLDSINDNLLGAAVLEFAETLKTDQWSGTPAELLAELNSTRPFGFGAPRGWPDNPIAMSKRLVGLQTALSTQQVVIEFSRGKHRTITITVKGVSNV